ncbi:UDP-glycosyltransferase 708D1 [Cajanus cajan]|uniref:Glycosyltransferase n=3 Tax=Cajanus cajan TaxID=3821 RepID=A0A151QUB3_CAJCA|nr:UDP-glycosyltransferase 708D1 [Cajanus cajan]KYP33870.1 Anthocyanidin 5,3-O-glucosyltransferase [Cajanus cajan]
MSAPESVVHVAFLPSAGMGHLNPCLRIAALFLRHGCKVTLITPKPTVSTAESNLISRFCSSFTHQVTQIDLNLTTVDPTTVNTNDPFWLQYETIRRSVHLVAPILSSLSTPLTAFIYDVFLISPLLPITQKLSCPRYIYFTSASRMLSFFAHLSVLTASDPTSQPHPSSFIRDVVKIPGIASPIPRSSLPPPLLQPNSLFESMFMEDSGKLAKLDGVFINSFEELEGEALAALNQGKVVKGLPPVYGVGPIMACEFENEEQGQRGCMGSILEWLDGKSEGSVVYVSLGSRTETRREQIKDMALGLIESGYSFLWVVKLKVVDKEEEEGLEDVLGSELMNKVKEKGVVVKEFVDQMGILGHPSVGGFVSHGGWNSVIESVWEGVPILTWPQGGDQKITSEAVRINGVGIWPQEWGWGSEHVVKWKEIADRIKEMMGNESLRVKAEEMKKAARNAAGVGGSCEVIVKKLIDEWKKNVQAT